MTREQAKIILPMLTAFAEGKQIQWRGRESERWYDCQYGTNFSFNIGDGHEYRIKPEPTLRPWKPEEVPVGVIVKKEGLQTACEVIIYKDDFGRVPLCNGIG